MPLHIGKGRSVATALKKILNYAMNPKKTEQGKYISCFTCDKETVCEEFLLLKQQYINITGRVRGRDDVIAYQIRQSFPPGEVTPEQANCLGYELAKRLTKGRYAYIVCTHTDKDHTHNHIIWAATSLDCNRKFRNFWGSTKAVRKLSDMICIENGLSIVENPKRHGKSYNKWLGDKTKLSHRDRLKFDIDNVFDQNPKDFNDLLRKLIIEGYSISSGKVIKFNRPEWLKPVRINSLGKGYSEEDLVQKLSSDSQAVTPKKKVSSGADRKMNLLIDIQEKLREGKGTNYQNWAKVYNLKQMAHTLNYLKEHDLLDYEILLDQANIIKQDYLAANEQIEQIDNQLKEIAELEMQIFNYAKTREIYTAYQKSGYSKKFYNQHETEINQHKKAKAAFSNLNAKKLPTIKSLKEKYSELLKQKKALYPKYRACRNEYKEIMTAKTNVEQLLGKGKNENRKIKKEKER